jgi:hypothetical protein
MRPFLTFFLFLLGTTAFAEAPVNSGAVGAGKAFNPDISVNFLGLAEHDTSLSSDRTQSPHNGIQLQEAELQAFADVDPYLKAVALFSISQKSGSTDFGIDPEEVYVESISLPVVTLRAGKFKMALGRHNQLHTHAFPFIDAPLIHQRLLGSEGLNESGVSAAALLPMPWYSELTLQGFSLANSNLFNSQASGDWGELAHFKNLWDLSDETTLEFGLSDANGENQYSHKANVFGSDLTMKWRPEQGGKYQALIWSTEYLLGSRPGLVDANGKSQQKLGGLATWLQYQFAERWWVEGRYEYVGIGRSPGNQQANKQSALLAFLPSEFSGLRLQVDRLNDSSRQRVDHAVAFQYNVTIGAHPAHSY